MNKSETKRIVLVVPAFPRTSETFIVSKFSGLLQRGWDAHLVCYESEPGEWAMFPALEADDSFRRRVHRAWPFRPKWLGGLLLVPALFRGLVRAPRAAWNYLVQGYREFGWAVFQKYYLDLEIICLQPDILHIEFGAFAVGRAYLGGLLDCKLSVSFRGYDLNFSGLDQDGYYDQVWKKADACHFLGEDLRQRALRRGCPAGMPHRLIPPAIDLSQFPADEGRVSDTVGSPEKPVRILSVGRLEWKKGYEFALQAIRMLSDQGVACIYEIIGDGEHRNALYFARHQLELDNSVKFRGSLAHDLVIQALNQTDIFLHPSLSEGFCNAVLEAQAMGLLVVCSDAGGLAENVADGVTGFVVPRRDPRAMAEKLALFANDPTLRQAMGSAGRMRVQSCFRLDQQLDAWEKFYQELL